MAGIKDQRGVLLAAAHGYSITQPSVSQPYKGTTQSIHVRGLRIRKYHPALRVWRVLWREGLIRRGERKKQLGRELGALRYSDRSAATPKSIL